MSSGTDALVITCIDARLHQADRPYVADFLRGKHVGVKTWDLATAPGAAQALAVLDFPSVKDSLLRSVKIAHEADGVSRVLLVNHSDCEAYGGTSAFGNAADEYRKHAEDLRTARQVLRDAFPTVDSRLFYATVERRPDGPFVTLDEVR